MSWARDGVFVMQGQEVLCSVERFKVYDSQAYRDNGKEMEINIL